MSLPMLQVALDNQTMDSAYETTRLIAEEVDIIEVDHIRVPVMIAILAEQRSIRSATIHGRVLMHR